MKPLITQYFEALEAQLVVSPLIRTFNVIRREVTPVDGKIRVRATLVDGGLLDLFEYGVEKDGQVHLRKYSFHWQGDGGGLIRRWDNAPHHPEISTHPHHKHTLSGVETAEPPDLSDVLREIDRYLGGGHHA